MKHKINEGERSSAPRGRCARSAAEAAARSVPPIPLPGTVDGLRLVLEKVCVRHVVVRCWCWASSRQRVVATRSAADGDPPAVITAYEAARNRGDIDTAVSSSPTTPPSPSATRRSPGKDEIRKLPADRRASRPLRRVRIGTAAAISVSWTERTARAGQNSRKRQRGGRRRGRRPGRQDPVAGLQRARRRRRARPDPALEGRAQLPAPARPGPVVLVLARGGADRARRASATPTTVAIEPARSADAGPAGLGGRRARERLESSRSLAGVAEWQTRAHSKCAGETRAGSSPAPGTRCWRETAARILPFAVMPRSIWTGVITFGMVSIPVKLYPATQDKDVSFHLLHQPDHSRIRFKRFCAAEDEEVPQDELVKALRGQQRAVRRDHRRGPRSAAAARPSTPSSCRRSSSPRDIDPIYYEKSYYLEPEETGVKPYALLMKVARERRSSASRASRFATRKACARCGRSSRAGPRDAALPRRDPRARSQPAECRR